MKPGLFVISSLVIVAAVAAAPQPPAGAQGGQKIGIAQSLQNGYNNLKRNLTGAADKLSEADYSFKAGTMPEVRNFGALFAHVAQAQFGQCSAVKGVPNPNQGKNLEEELKTKADITKALADSFATDENALQTVRLGNNELTRASALYGVLVHGNEMYGTSAVYLRLKGVVPPSTEGRGRRGREN